jgi:hypothetical protein
MTAERKAPKHSLKNWHFKPDRTPSSTTASGAYHEHTHTQPSGERTMKVLIFAVLIYLGLSALSASDLGTENTKPEVMGDEPTAVTGY